MIFALVKSHFHVKIEKTVENFEMSFLPVVGQKYRFSLPFLRGKMIFFSKKVKNRNFEIFSKMSFLPVVDQKCRFSLPFLREKMTFF